MATYSSDRDDDQFASDLDLGQIFIGREQQMDLFEVYLNRWKRSMAAVPVAGSTITTTPHPNNKLQGLVVLLYGRGGFGKSTLLQHYQQAIDDYTRAIELDPKPSTYYNRGLAYSELKLYQQAITDYTRAIELDPKDAAAYSNRALAYIWVRDAQQAKDAYRRSWELDKTDINSPWMAEWVEMSRERTGRETAVRLEEIAAADPENYVAYVCRAVALGLGNRLQEGLAEIEQAIQLTAEWWDAYFWKGMLCVYSGRNQAATEAFEKALAVDLPPLLLTPLYWLEKDRPTFFRDYAASLLARYDV